MGLTTRVGVQTHHRPSNYDGPWSYFENYGSITPTARYLPKSYGILVFLLGSSVKAQLYVIPPCLQEIGLGKDLSRNGKNRRIECSILLGEYGFYGDGGKSEGTTDEHLGGKKTYTSPTWRGGGGVCPKDQNAMESTFTQ